jgi:uncharacterized membrane protein
VNSHSTDTMLLNGAAAVALDETPPPAIPKADHRSYRLSAIDMVRGLVIVIMAIDHVRDFCMVAGELEPMANPDISVGLFATRWITHFCAPVFVLLAGTSAGLMAARKSHAELARFLVTRGLWLIVVEMFVVSTAVTFAPGGIAEVGGLVLANMQVIWVIGAGMIVLAGLQWMGRRACLAVGAGVLLAHNLLDAYWPASSLFDQQWPLWVALHAQMSHRAGPFLFVFIYPLLPWVGVMLFGFGVAAIFERPPHRRNAILLRTGVALTAAFVLLRAFVAYGDPNSWQIQAAGMTATLIDFLNTTKYPPSLAFLLMTLGPAAILCALADRMTGPLKNALVMFGRVPFAFYVMHVVLIHALSVLLGVVQGFSLRQMMTVFLFYPKGFGVGLPGVYAIWLLVVLMLYPFCRSVAAVKSRRRDWWLSYV